MNRNHCQQNIWKICLLLQVNWRNNTTANKLLVIVCRPRSHKQNRASDLPNITANSKLLQESREEHRISVRAENYPRFTSLSGFFLPTDAERAESKLLHRRLFFCVFSFKHETSWSTPPILQSGASSSEVLSVCNLDLLWKVLESEHGLWMALCKLNSDETSILRLRDHRLS